MRAYAERQRSAHTCGYTEIGAIPGALCIRLLYIKLVIMVSVEICNLHTDRGKAILAVGEYAEGR